MTTFVRLPLLVLRPVDHDKLQTKSYFINPDTVRCVCESEDNDQTSVMLGVGEMPRFCPLSPEAIVARLTGEIPRRQPLPYELAMMKSGDHVRDTEWKRWTLVRQYQDQGSTLFVCHDQRNILATFDEDGKPVYEAGLPTQPPSLHEVEIPRS